MAVATIYPTHVAYSDWTLVGTADPITAMSDGDGGTAYHNYNPMFVHTASFYSTGTKPADMVGATITNVTLGFNMSASANKGTFTVGINGLSSQVAAVPFPGTFDITAYKSWTHADFYTASTVWFIQSNGDADNSTLYVPFSECYLQVTYTPVTAPTAAFTASTTTGTSPLTVTFTDQSTNSPTSWYWQFGDTSTSTLQNPVHIYSTSATATYTVTLTATNGGGSDDEVKSSYITVDPATAAAVANFTAAPVSGAQNLGVQFYDASTGTPAVNAWVWNFGDGSSTTTEQNPLHVYTTVGVYTVTLTASNATPTTDSEVKTSYITVVNGKPVPAAAASTTTGVKPLDVQFTGSATNALPTSWGWDFGDGQASVAQSPLHQYTTVGTFTPTLTVTNAIGTASTTVGPITVGFATVTASFTAGPLMGYIPLTVRFTDQSLGDANSWTWNFGDGSLGYEQHPVHTYTTTAVGATLTITQTGLSDDYWLRYGLTNYWKMEEGTGTADRDDYIGSLDLTPSATVTQATGKNNYGTSLDVAEYLEKSTGVAWTTAYSYSGWFYLSTVAGNNTFYRPGGISGSHLYQSIGVFSLLGPGGTSGTGATAVTAGAWHHVVYTFDGTSRYRAYLNGVLEIEIFDSTTNSGVAFRTGAPSTGTMVVDEIGRYGHEMGQDQVSALYNAGAGEFFNVISTSDSQAEADLICPMMPDRSWGYFFEELKYQLMEPMYEQTVCEGFDSFGGMAKAVEFAQARLKRFVLETAALRKESTLSTADSSTENFALPTDLIELLRVEVDGSPYYPADPLQRDFDSGALNTYFQKDALSITIPGTYGSTPVVKVLYSYVPSTPSVPAPCTCPSSPNTGPWAAFPLPYVLWWIIRYGTMADMFSQSGERNDTNRAKKCEELFSFGTEIYKHLYRGGS